MKQFLILIFFAMNLFSNEMATKDDIKEIRKDIRESNRVILEVIKANQEATKV